MSRSKGSLLVILSAIIYGLVPLIAKIVYSQGGTPLEASLLKGSLALPVLWLLMRYLHIPPRMAPEMHVSAFILSLGACFTQMLLFSSYQHISSGLSTTLHFTYPVFVVLACILFFQEKASGIKLLCVTLCTVGIFLFYTPGESFNLFGAALAFISGMTYAFYVVYLSRGKVQHLHPFALAFWSSLYTSIETLIILLCTRSLTLALTPAGWGAAFLFSFFTTVIALVVFQMGLKIVGPQKASILSTFEPIVSIVVGVIVYQEPLGFRTAVGTALVLLAAILLAAFDKTDSSNPESSRG